VIEPLHAVQRRPDVVHPFPDGLELGLEREVLLPEDPVLGGVPGHDEIVDRGRDGDDRQDRQPAHHLNT
jgi:hypothetical protein